MRHMHIIVDQLFNIITSSLIILREAGRRRMMMLWWCCVVIAAFGCNSNNMIRYARAQTSGATTDPSEARIVNSMLQSHWGISSAPMTTSGHQWNISGELCSGAAIDPSIQIDSLNPGIKCDCSYDNSTTCHITALWVSGAENTIPGPLPDGLWNLIYLTNLNFGQNYFTGSISPSIGNLTRMQYMSFAENALSGELPNELGRLTDLRSLYFISSGVSGPIPPTFARLRSLEKVWASSNDLTGPIPSFIGTWSALSVLKLQGNSFTGSIPASISNLTSLTVLKISDISNGSSSLDFLRSMTSLSTVVLRNNNISGPIPLYFGEFSSLRLLDLSFNNLIGSIPDSLFNIRSLTHLFLGSNRLNGALPSQRSPSLHTIDLSYNELSGSFPSWVNGQNLQLNFVFNNFTIDNSDSTLPSGLGCLQRNFPCNRGSPIYSSFAIKCGGEQITTSDQRVYETDNQAVGPATYYVTSTRRWAVSNVGLPADSSNPLYLGVSSSQFTNTLDWELFQTARLSAGSLRYYGLGMENGNYTVTLQFAEIEILGTRTWTGLGRRVFDIYIQGNRVLRDFEIRREAEGISSRTAVRVFGSVEVVENYMEIHLFWAGKGTPYVPRQGLYGPLVSAISATPNFVPTVSNNPPSIRRRSRTGIIVTIIVAVGAASLLSLVVGFYVFQKRRKHRNLKDEELFGTDLRPYTFSYAELKAATQDFDPANKLGEGGFGPVYKGTLENGKVVAVKQLSVASHQGKSQFMAEIATISAVQHRNLVKLYGCCIDGVKRLLVYEYLVNKSLDKLLFGTGTKSLYLNWATRYNICLGVARGLAYLHEDSRIRIVHRDVKASNILLDSKLTPKISDFGLAKLYDDKDTHISTKVAGTIGYLAPEYAMRGHLTEKADIFSFGVLAIEIVSGRSNGDPSLKDDTMYLLEWAWNLHENKREIELVDPTLQEFDVNEVKKIIDIALLCTQTSPSLRPTMSRVVGMLSGDIEVPSVTGRPGYLTDWIFSDVNTFATYTSTDDPSASTGTAVVPDSPVVDSATPVLHEIIGEGREMS